MVGYVFESEVPLFPRWPVLKGGIGSLWKRGDEGSSLSLLLDIRHHDLLFFRTFRQACSPEVKELWVEVEVKKCPLFVRPLYLSVRPNVVPSRLPGLTELLAHTGDTEGLSDQSPD